MIYIVDLYKIGLHTVFLSCVFHCFVFYMLLIMVSCDFSCLVSDSDHSDCILHFALLLPARVTNNRQSQQMILFSVGNAFVISIITAVYLGLCTHFVYRPKSTHLSLVSGTDEKKLPHRIIWSWKN